MEKTTVLRRNPRVAAREIADQGAVLLHLDSGAYHGVNGVGWAIWSLLDQDRTLDALLTQLRDTLTAVPSSLEADVASFLADLETRDLIHRDGPRLRAV